MDATAWFAQQPDLIEGRCKCRMTLAACQRRQEKYAHKAIIGNGREDHHVVTRHYFIPCRGDGSKEACPYYTPRERDPKTYHTSFEVGQHRIGKDSLEEIHKRNRFNRAVQGIHARIGE